MWFDQKCRRLCLYFMSGAVLILCSVWFRVRGEVFSRAIQKTELVKINPDPFHFSKSRHFCHNDDTPSPHNHTHVSHRSESAFRTSRFIHFAVHAHSILTVPWQNIPGNCIFFSLQLCSRTTALPYTENSSSPAWSSAPHHHPLCVLTQAYRLTLMARRFIWSASRSTPSLFFLLARTRFCLFLNYLTGP